MWKINYGTSSQPKKNVYLLFNLKVMLKLLDTKTFLIRKSNVPQKLYFQIHDVICQRCISLRGCEEACNAGPPLEYPGTCWISRQPQLVQERSVI